MRHIHTVRYIRDMPIPRLDLIDLSSGNTGSDHTHPNQTFLDNLNIDNQLRLLYENVILSVPMLQEDW